MGVEVTRPADLEKVYSFDEAKRGKRERERVCTGTVILSFFDALVYEVTVAR